MKAITLHRPWPWAILWGGKRIENRSWPPWPSQVGKRIALHAGKVFDSEVLDAFWDGKFSDAARRCPGRGEGCHPQGIVGVATITGHFRYDGGPTGNALFALQRDSVWAFGPRCWVLDNVIPLPTAIPCPGALGMWDVPAHVLARVNEQLGGAR